MLLKVGRFSRPVAAKTRELLCAGAEFDFDYSSARSQNSSTVREVSDHSTGLESSGSCIIRLLLVPYYGTQKIFASFGECNDR